MARGPALKRTGALRRLALVAATTRRETGFDRRTKALILDRDGHACVCCGLTAAQTRIVCHHRRNRGHGGSKDPVTNGPANGIACCWTCNDLMESSAPRATEARARGWKLTAGQNPLQVPVIDWVGRHWYLDAHGQRVAA